MRASKPPSQKPWNVFQRMRPTGARAAWRRKAGCRSQACSASGEPSVCSLIGWRRSALDRPGFRGQGARCGRSLRFPTPACRRPVCGRESRRLTQPTHVAHAPRPAGTAQPRLHAPRHDLALSSARHCDGQGHRQMLFPSPRYFSMRSSSPSRAASMCISSWTTTPLTRPH